MTIEALRSELRYDPETGHFYSLRNTSRRKIGDVAGFVEMDGYRSINVLSMRFYAHRLAWFYVHHEWPRSILDHINGDRDDNRIGNLRLSNPSLNAANSKLTRKNTSGLKGVYPERVTGKWKAGITVKGGAAPFGDIPHNRRCSQRIHGGGD